MPTESDKFKYLTSGTGLNAKRIAVVKASAEQENKIYDQLLKSQLASETKAHEDRLAKMKARQDAYAIALAEGNKTEAARLSKSLARYKKLEKNYSDQLIVLKQKAADIAADYELNKYSKLSARKRLEASESVAKELASRKVAVEKALDAELAEFQELESRKGSLTTKEENRRLQLEASTAALQTELSDVTEKESVAVTAFDRLFDAISTKSEKAEKAAKDYAKAETDRQRAAAEAKQALKEYKDALKAGSGVTQDEIDRLKDLADAKNEEAKASDKAAKAALKKANVAKRESDATETLQEKQKRRADQFAKVANAVNDKISSNLDALYGSQSRMVGRLQGSDIDWQKALVHVTTTVGMSGMASQKAIVAKMVDLVDSGVAYNLEMRAFLAETSENIASTFDAANGTLLRLIRLQQADTTAARLGMEAVLTNLFNTAFKDTSYLTDSGPSDSVASAILDASATMGRDEALKFEFTVQKWLGSLYSLGMSSDAVQKVAEGLNYLGTGKVSALSNNSALQMLFGMSASRSTGKSYAELLNTGLNSDETNKLLRSMVEYLAEISNSQTNYVTKAAYAELFDMSTTDLSTFASLRKEEIENIYNQSVSYDALVTETQGQLRSIAGRKSMAQLVDTVIENAGVGAASLIGSNAFTYGTWKALSLLKEYVGEIKIPGITAAGFGIASGLDLLNLAQTVMAGMGLIGQLIGGLGSMFNGGPANLANWDFEPYTQRGGGLSILNVGSTETTSYSAMIGAGGGSAEDIETVTMESGKDKGNEASGTSSEEMEEQKEIPQKIYDALAGDSSLTVLSLLQEIDDRLDPSRVFYTAISGVLSRDTVSQVTNLSAQLATAKATIEATNEQGSTTNDSTKSATGVTVSGSTQGENSSNVNSQALSGNGVSPLDGTVMDLSSMITDAVATALNSVLTSNSYSGIPVRITNGG